MSQFQSKTIVQTVAVMTTTEHLAPLTMFKLFVSKVKLKKATSCMYHKNLPCQVQMSCAGARPGLHHLDDFMGHCTAPRCASDLERSRHQCTRPHCRHCLRPRAQRNFCDEIGTMSAQSRAVHSAQWVRQSTLRQRTMDRNHI